MGLGRVDFQRRLPAQNEAYPGLTGLRGGTPERGVRRSNESRAYRGMTARLGKNQRSLLKVLGNVSALLIVGDNDSRALTTKGYVRPLGQDGYSFYAITPAGLRRLADDLEAGIIEQKLPERKDTE